MTLQNKTQSYDTTLKYFKDGIIHFATKNLQNKYDFNFYDVEERPKLTPLHIHIAEQTETQMALQFSNDKDQQQASYKSGYKLIISFNPFNMELINKEGKSVLKFNSRSNLRACETVGLDFQFPTHYLWGLPQRADYALLQDQSNQKPPKRIYRLHCRDTFAPPPYSPVGVYGAAPIIVNLHDYESRGLTGIYNANPSELFVEVNKQKSGVSDVFWFQEVGDIELYLIASDKPTEFFYRLAQVTGFSYLPPLWGLGFHQCKMDYYYQDQVLEVNDRLKAYNIPCDCIHLDIEYTNGFKYFEWNTNTFQDPAELIKKIRANKRRVVCIQDPHVKMDEYYSVYSNAKKQGLLIRSANGAIYDSICWPGNTTWLDLVNQEGLDYWASLYSYENFKYSTRDVHAWNDMSEPACFSYHTGKTLPATALLYFVKNGEKKEVEHRYIHNMYGHLTLKGTFKGLVQRDYPQKYRPFVIGRSYFAGSQKYSLIWTGDSASKFIDLKFQISNALNCGMCSLAFVGADVGGFFGDAPPETMCRWYQYVAFTPFFRSHGWQAHNFKEPYVFAPKYRKIIASALRERYKWLYYWYATCEDYVRTGMPMMRGIWLDTKGKLPVTPSSLVEEEQFLLGDSVLVIPILREYQRYVQIHEALREEEWFTQESGYVKDNSQPYKVGLERIGVFIRAGSIMPFVDLPE